MKKKFSLLVCSSYFTLNPLVLTGVLFTTNVAYDDRLVTRFALDVTFETFPNTAKRVENMTRSGVFLTNVEVFGNVVKHFRECLIYLLNRN